MKLTPVTGPGQVQDLSTPEHVRTAKMQAAYSKAISAPTQGNAQETPVANPNSISAEELSAVKAQTQPETTETTANIAEDKPQDLQTKPDPETERRFQQLARQERALRAKAHQQAKDLKTREEALKAREAELQARYKEPDYSQYIPKARLQEDALGVLEAEGIATYDDLTQRALNRQPVDPLIRSTMEKMQAKIDALEQAAANGQKNYQEQQQQNYQAAIKQIKTDVKNLVSADPEFETIKSTNAVQDVVELIEETYRKDGIVLSVEEAATEVENYLVEEAIKISNIDKIKKRMEASNASRATSEKKPQLSQQPQMKTLTNATSSTRPLTARERAIAAAEGRLKS